MSERDKIITVSVGDWDDNVDCIQELEEENEQQRSEIARLIAQVNAAREAMEAGVRYDALLQKAGEHPELVSAYGMVEGDDLDIAFDEWIGKTRAWLAANPASKEGEKP